MGVTCEKRTLGVFQIHIIAHGHMRAGVIGPPGAKGRRPLIGGREGEFFCGLREAAIWSPLQDHILANTQHE